MDGSQYLKDRIT